MTNPWRYRTTQDKLKVFVSSRIQECSEERSVVQDAIISLSHQPVLFEHLGAKSYAPRDLYLSRLQDSQAMVAIYRSGYGYIDSANGMNISGIEDEFLFAKRQGIESLFYVRRSAEDRDPRLSALIKKIESGPYTVSYYDDPQQLRDRVRDDLTALITDKFLRADTQRQALQEDSTNVLLRTTHRAGIIISREAVIDELRARSQESPILCLNGPPGIGKTTLSAQFTEAEGAVFVRVSGLAPIDVFNVCTNALRGRNSSDAKDYSTLESSRLALASAWAQVSSVTLVVDECNFIPELIDALSAGGDVSIEKRLIFTTREPSTDFPNFQVPSLTQSESKKLLHGANIPAEAVSDLIKLGNPLQLHQALLRLKFGSGTTSFEHIEGSAGEILRYLALSNTPLSAEDLLQLRSNDNDSIEALYADIKQLGPLVDDTARGFRLMHSETALNIDIELRKSPQRYRFFINRLVRLFEDARDFRRVYEFTARLNDGSERKYAAAAIRQAVWLGDWRSGVKLIEKLLEQALDEESKSEAFHLMLSLVYPLELMGDVQRALEVLEKAQSLADTLGSSAQLTIEEARISSRARRGLSIEDVDALKNLYRRYGEESKQWDQARIGLELSAIYIAAKEFEQAREILLPTLTTFEEVGDDYGIDLTQRNLASALSAIPGYEEEAERLMRVIQERASDESDTRRQRAWLCNILTRRLRRAERYEEAEALAKEAIEIGADLADESVRAINLINLGNNYRDQERPQEAIEAYHAAAVAAQSCGRRDIEADSSRLIAGIFNDFEIYKVNDRRQQARTYAQHAIGLLRGTLNHDGRAHALLELADAQSALGEKADAAKAFFDAARDFARVPDEKACYHSLALGSHLALPDHPEMYIECLADVLGMERPDSEETLGDQFIALIVPMIERSPRGALMPQLSEHLHQIWSHLPKVMRAAFVSTVFTLVQNFARDNKGNFEPWRILYTGIVLSSMLKETANPFLHSRLVRLMTLNVEDLFARQEGASQIWTVVLSLGRRVVITISTLDDTPETALASSALAMFIKAFEDELNRELIGSGASIDELDIEIGHIDHFSEEIRRMADSTLGLTETLRKQACAITRPSDFGSNYPTWIVLSPTFNEEILFGEGRGGSLQVLFGFTLIEITFQLLRGQVDIETIRPKVVSLVRKTI
jgi:tetratricopeptide (TPR) repeat protein